MGNSGCGDYFQSLYKGPAYRETPEWEMFQKQKQKTKDFGRGHADWEQNVGGRRELVGKWEVAVSSWKLATLWTNALAAANKRKEECKK